MIRTFTHFVHGSFAKCGRKTLHRNLLFVFLLFILAKPVIGQSLVHPGVFYSIGDLNKLKVNKDIEPFKSSYAIFNATPQASLNYTMLGPFQTVGRETNLNLTQYESDMLAVYYQAIQWTVTGDSTYAKKAISIINAWSTTHTTWSGSTPRLAAGYDGFNLAVGAEILRYTYPGWTASTTTNLNNYITNVMWPMQGGLPDGTIPNLGDANQGAIMLMGATAGAIFLNDVNKYNNCITAFREHTCAGIRSGTLPSGQFSDFGRDQTHASIMLTDLLTSAEMGYVQGADLFGDLNNRLLACSEYYSKYNMGQDVPFVNFGACYGYYTRPSSTVAFPEAERAVVRQIQGQIELVSNAYIIRKGLQASYTVQYGINNNLSINESLFLIRKQYDTPPAPLPALPIIPAILPQAVSQLTATDIGVTGLAGTTSYNAANSSWKLSGAGTRVGKNSDSFHFAYTSMTGDCAIVARVYSSEKMAGVMMRSSLTDTARMAATNLYPNLDGGNFFYRVTAGGGTSVSNQANACPQPFWIKLIRKGDNFSSYVSYDGVTWSPIRFANIPMPSTIYVGLYSCSNSTSTLSNAVFDHVSIGIGGTEYIGGMAQSVTFPPLSKVRMDSPGFNPYLDPGATSSSGLPVTYVCADTTVASFVNGKIFIKKPGTTAVAAVQIGNEVYNASMRKMDTLVVENRSFNQLLPGIYYIRNAATNTDYTYNVTAGTLKFSVLPSDTTLSLWRIERDQVSNRFKITNYNSGKFLNEWAVFTTNKYDAAWNTFNLHFDTLSVRYAVQRAGSAGNNYWNINSTDNTLIDGNASSAIPSPYPFKFVPYRIYLDEILKGAKLTLDSALASNYSQESYSIFAGLVSAAQAKRPSIVTYDDAVLWSDSLSNGIAKFNAGLIKLHPIVNGAQYYVKSTQGAYKGKYLTNSSPGPVFSVQIAGSTTQQWKLDLDPTTNRYKVTNASSGKFIEQNGFNATTAYASGWHSFNFYSNGYDYAIQNADFGGTNFWTISSTGTISVSLPYGPSYFGFKLILAAEADLKVLVDKANLERGASIGSNLNQYPQSKYDALISQLTPAQALVDTGSSRSSDYVAVYNNLNTAYLAFKNSMNLLKNQLADGTYYIKAISGASNGLYLTHGSVPTFSTNIPGSNTQQWIITKDATSGRYKIVSASSGKYINEGGGYGTKAYLSAWNSFNLYYNGTGYAMQNDQSAGTNYFTISATGTLSPTLTDGFPSFFGFKLILTAEADLKILLDKANLERNASVGTNLNQYPQALYGALINQINISQALYDSGTASASDYVTAYNNLNTAYMNFKNGINVLKNQLPDGIYYIRALTGTSAGTVLSHGGNPNFAVGIAGGSSTQRWSVTKDATTGRYKITNVSSGKYINERGIYGTNAFSAVWNTFNLYYNGAGYAMQNDQSGGTNYFTITAAALAATLADGYPSFFGFLFVPASDYNLQTITFPDMALKSVGDADFSPLATASSGLAVSYTSADTTIAKIVLNNVRILKSGSVSITAVQPGTTFYTAATPVVKLLTISKKAQALTFTSLAQKSIGDTDFDGGAATDSGLPVSYSSSNLAVASIVNGKIHIIGLGNAIITASQPGNVMFMPANTISQTLTVNKKTQSVTFPALSQKTVGDPDFNPNAVSSASLAVDYNSSNTGVATIVNGYIHIVGAGTSLITVAQNGNAEYFAAANVDQILNVVKRNQDIAFNPIPQKTIGDFDFDAGGFTTSGLTVSYSSSNSGVATIIGDKIHIVGVGSCTITAAQDGDAIYLAASHVNRTLTVLKKEQNIVFSPIQDKTVGDADFNASATATSSLSVNYTSSNPAVATVVGGIIHITGAGTTVITAFQEGSSDYLPIRDVSQTLTVLKKDQNITFNELLPKIAGDADFLAAAAASSDLPISYVSSDTTVAKISGSFIHIIKAGSTTITASQAGNELFNAAPSLSHVLKVFARQTITFNPLSFKTTTDVDFDPGAVASSGLSVVYTSIDTTVATISGGKIHITGPGMTTITATQAGNDDYAAATAVEQSLKVKALQNIGFASLQDKTTADVEFDPGAVASSALPVTYASSDTTVATIIGGKIHIIGPGITTITAFQAGNDIYAKASSVQQSLNVRAVQSISFASFPTKTTVDVDFDPGAVASSGLPVAYTSSDTAVATIVSGNIHITGPGTVKITATQIGNDAYAAASAVQQSLLVKATQSITFAPLQSKTTADVDFDPGALASSGLAVVYTSSDTTIATITGGKIHIIGSGTVTITASQAGNGGYAAASAVQQSLLVKATQSITFAPLQSKTTADVDFDPGALASSGLAVVYTSSDTTIATITGGKIHIAGSGTVTITALQAGNGGYAAASAVQQSLLVKATQSITFAPLQSKTTADVDFDPGAFASSGLAVAYTSSDTTIATIIGGKIHIAGSGTTTITASQLGNSIYAAAPSVSLTLNVRATQMITFNPIAEKGDNDPDFDPAAYSSSGLTVVYSSSDTTVAAVIGTKVHILKAGSTTITAHQTGNNVYSPATPVSVFIDD